MCALLNLFSLLILMFSVSASDYRDTININDVVPTSGELETASQTFLEDFRQENMNSSANDCNCGEYSTGCTLSKGRKICSCQPGYAVGRNMICVESCNETHACANGGSCLQHVCMCLPGTSGDFCKTVDDCEDYKLCAKHENVYCKYSIEKQRAQCNCRVVEYRFDDASRTCKNCICSPGWASDFRYFSFCEYQKGKKMCTCRKGYAYNPTREYCDNCNCGENSKWCKFDQKGEKICTCKDGYSVRYGECIDCKCGHGKCDYLYNFYKDRYCICDAGYEEFNRICVDCKCGKYGNCIFDNDGNQTGCKCKAGYEEKLGVCEMCYCGDNANCSFNGNMKVCDCEKGYHDINGFCEDIDECEKHNPCDSSSICINTPGSHKCLCAEGYEVKEVTGEDGIDIKTCADIDECKNPNSCTMPDSECLNTVGSFACVCKPGYVSRGGIGSHSFCESTSDGSIYTVAIVTIFTVLLILLGFYVFSKRSSRNAGSSSHELNAR